MGATHKLKPSPTCYPPPIICWPPLTQLWTSDSSLPPESTPNRFIINPNFTCHLGVCAYTLTLRSPIQHNECWLAGQQEDFSFSFFDWIYIYISFLTIYIGSLNAFEVFVSYCPEGHQIVGVTLGVCTYHISAKQRVHHRKQGKHYWHILWDI